MKVLALIVGWYFLQAAAFVAPRPHMYQGKIATTNPRSVAFENQLMHPSLDRQRHSVAQVQMKGLFGLGFAEIAIIAIAIGFLLGPQKVAQILKSGASQASEMKDELTKVPEEFRRGMEEGEIEARARKARPMKKRAADKIAGAEDEE